MEKSANTALNWFSYHMTVVSSKNLPLVPPKSLALSSPSKNPRTATAKD